MQKPERVYKAHGPFFGGKRVHRLQTLPLSSSEPIFPSASQALSQDDAWKDTTNDLGSTANLTDRDITIPSLRPRSSSENSINIDLFPIPLQVQGTTNGKRRRAVTEPIASDQQPASKKPKSTATFPHVRQRSIMTLFNGVNTKPVKKPSTDRSRSNGTSLSLFSGFSGAHYCVDEPKISEIYRPLDKAVDPRINRPFRYFAKARTYGPGDIRIINVPPPNTPNLAEQMSIAQSQHVSPTDGIATSSEAGPPVPSDPQDSYFRNFEEQQYASSPQVSVVGFWHKSLASTRGTVITKYCQTLFILLVAIFVFLVLGIGVLYETESKIPTLSVAVVNFDTDASSLFYSPIIGPYISSFCQAQSVQRQHLDYQFPNSTTFGNSPERVSEAVHNHQYWAAIVINPNATRLLLDALTYGNESYNPSDVATVIYNEARDAQVYEAYITPVLDRLALDITTAFGTFWSHNIISDPTFNKSLSTLTPQALSPGISFSFNNLRPIIAPVTLSLTSVSLIYLVFISFYSCTFFMHTHILFVLRHPSLKFSHLIVYRWCATIVAYFFFALVYSLATVTMQTPFTYGISSNVDALSTANPNPYGGVIDTFIAYLALNFLGTVALGLASENMAMFLSLLSPLPYSLLFLLFWIVTNASTSFYSLELANGFYKFGYAWPMHQMVEGTKTLVLGTRSNLPVNFAILVGWVVLGSVLFPLACWLMRWKGMRPTASSDGSFSDRGYEVEHGAPTLREEAMA